jgi:drug/metabolite transporter (DMT)-like permease
MDSRTATEPPTQARRGVLVGLITALAVAYPLAWTLSLTHAAVGGCWIDCGEPQPVLGIVLAIGSALLMAVPFAAGMRVARVRSRSAWAVLVVGVALVLLGWILWAGDNPAWFLEE